ncbi:Protein phosphatase 2C family protein [Perilla frutescens var. hirtella]|nr:Protein phosphatase 2C family protein [Perilla frutescens var. hirtella]
MGICASISSPGIHDDAYGYENAVYFTDINGNGSQSLGSINSHTGSKGLNQDCAIIYEGYGVEDGAFCAVFDGHGKNGHIVSKIVRNRLPSLLLSQRNSIAKISPSTHNSKLGSDQLGQDKNFLRWKDACVSAFKAVDREIKFLNTLDCSCSGTTASVVIKQGEDLIIANLGDSRAVLGTRTESGIIAVQLTTDLKPGVPSEAERIRKCNGRVLALKEEPHIQRVWLPYDDSPGLAMSRAFGDFVLKNNGIICIPDVTYHRLTPDDTFLVLASDGVWDVLSNEQVMSIVAAAHSEEGAAQAVVDAALASWKLKFPNSKRDDCTVICLFLHDK